MKVVGSAAGQMGIHLDALPICCFLSPCRCRGVLGDGNPWVALSWCNLQHPELVDSEAGTTFL